MVVDMRVKAFRVYGKEGHRFRGSFWESHVIKLSNGIMMNVINSDITGVNDYSILKFNSMLREMTDDEFEHELEAQLYDGVFECCNIGKVEEIPLYTLTIKCGKLRTSLQNLTIDEASKIRSLYIQAGLYFYIERQ